MALKIELKPEERLFIGEHVIINGNDRRMKVVIESKSRMLRESEILAEADAVTACDKLQVSLQHLYLYNDAPRFQEELVGLCNAIAESMPGFKQMVDEIAEHVNEERYYPALKVARTLREREKALLAAMGR